MFGIDNFTLFVITTTIFTITPGMDTIFVLNKSIAQGRRQALYASLGIMTGVLVHTLLATFGLSAVVARSAIVFSAIKYMGAAYLVFLGIKALWSSQNPLDVEHNIDFQLNKGVWQHFREGLFTNILNPKVALYFLSFFPQFIKKEAMESLTPYFVLGSFVIMIGVLWFVLLVYFASIFSEKFKENPKISVWVSKASGLIFILMGIKVAFSD